MQLYAGKNIIVRKGLSPAFSAKSTPPLASWEGGSAGPDGICSDTILVPRKIIWQWGLAPPPSHEAKGGVDLAENAGDSPLIVRLSFHPTATGFRVVPMSDSENTGAANKSQVFGTNNFMCFPTLTACYFETCSPWLTVVTMVPYRSSFTKYFRTSVHTPPTASTAATTPHHTTPYYISMPGFDRCSSFGLRTTLHINPFWTLNLRGTA
ncbi:hypothetical protein C8J57DRAFT_1216386 [Mycena rebaudengoi]|nr:hypothetical protein C8J57DRAFT_1216386 [Mycena rebaudengoi]